MRVLLAGLLMGVLLYAVTALPFVVLTGVDGDPWDGILMLYGVVCGVVGFWLAVWRWA